MEVEGPRFTPPEIRPGPPEWERYTPLRFSVRVRAAISVVISIVPVFLVVAAVLQVVLGDGRARAAFVILLLPLVTMGPLLVWAMRDLWGRWH